MKHDHAGMPEIIEAVERDGEYFGVVAVVLHGEALAFEFGINSEEYRALRDILQVRPFGSPDLGPCRYFFLPRTHRLLPESERGEFLVQMERGPNVRQFTAAGPRLLIANLTWFAELKYANGARHLRRVSLPAEIHIG